jgi:predicted flavoprotein YhiN
LEGGDEFYPGLGGTDGGYALAAEAGHDIMNLTRGLFETAWAERLEPKPEESLTVKVL